MINLNFVQEGTNYVAEFSVTGHFNVHLDIVQGSRCALYKKTVKEGEYSLERFIRNEMTSYDFDVDGDIATRWYKIIVAYPATGRVIETKTPSEGGEPSVEIEALKKEIAELLGKDPSNESAQTPQIDNYNEVEKFLEGYTNKDKLKDLLPTLLTEEQLQSIKDLIK